MRYVLLYITTASRDEAMAIGRTLVEGNLAACANVLPGKTSVYRWHGAIEQSDETVLLLKTRADLVDQATRRVVALHSYECPCVVSLPVESGNPPFLQWVSEQTAAADASV